MHSTLSTSKLQILSSVLLYSRFLISAKNHVMFIIFNRKPGRFILQNNHFYRYSKLRLQVRHSLTLGLIINKEEFVQSSRTWHVRFMSVSIINQLLSHNPFIYTDDGLENLA